MCPGDPTAYCGGGSRLTWYAWNLTDPLYKWNYPQGNDAGSYKFFVPGVVVPLMTTVNVNGKVTFVEKAGTGPPNSTGAFELDPSLVGAGDWRSAWRTMRGLKTDVFCSAGLILPDKAGRQINIGGWSGTSTVSSPLQFFPRSRPIQWVSWLFLCRRALQCYEPFVYLSMFTYLSSR